MKAPANFVDPPTVSVRIGNSTIAFETSGEMLETVDYDDDGTPNWTLAGVCDYRGAGGKDGYAALRIALTAAEENATLAGYEIVRIPPPPS